VLSWIKAAERDGHTQKGLRINKLYITVLFFNKYNVVLAKPHKYHKSGDEKS